MTKRLLLALALVALCMAGCGEDDEKDSGMPETPNQTEENANDSDDNHDDNVDEDTDECDPYEVCEDYCQEKYARCLNENCEGISNQAYMERELCMYGLRVEGEADEFETLIEGCVKQAFEGEKICEEYGDQAEHYAQQPCDGDEQLHRQCNELKITLAGHGPEVYERCDCSSAATAESCIDDEECHDYDDGICVAMDTDTPPPQPQGECIAECYDYDGDIPYPVLPDPSCGEETGVCLLLDRMYSDTPADGADSICQKYCTSLDDCPEGASCAPVFELQDGGALGLCTRGAVWETNFELCVDDEDCPPGTGCWEGTCQPACAGNDTPCDLGGCGEEGVCEVDFQELY